MPDYPTISYTAYPTGADVEAWLKSKKLFPPDSESNQQDLARRQCVIAANSAAATWEAGVDWNPFLAGWNETDDEPEYDRYFDRASHSDGQFRVLRFDGAAQSITTVEVNDTELVDGTDFWKHPTSAPRRNNPIVGIKFRHGVNVDYFSTPGKIVVTAEWGYCSTLPEEVYQLCLGYAVVDCLISTDSPDVAISVALDGFSVSTDAVAPVDAKTSLAALREDLKKKAAASQYRRVSF